MSEPANDMSLLGRQPAAEPVIHPLGRLEFLQPMGVCNLTTSHPWGMRIGDTDYLVPAGMESDGMSIWKGLWTILGPPFYSLAVPGVILHDAGYGGLLRGIDSQGDLCAVDKDTVDELLFEVARWNGYPAWKCHAIYRGVRLGGANAWRNSHARNADVDLRRLDYDWTRQGLYA